MKRMKSIAGNTGALQDDEVVEVNLGATSSSSVATVKKRKISTGLLNESIVSTRSGGGTLQDSLNRMGGVPSSSAYSLQSSTTNDAKRATYFPPDKLHTALLTFFDFFWDLDIAHPAANGAFFGRIDDRNYMDFGLLSYLTPFVNFPVIKVCIGYLFYSL